MPTIRILVVDDSAQWRVLVGLILRRSPLLQVIGEARDGVEAIEQAATLLPLEDAQGRQWSFVEKTAIVSAEHLDAETSYPQRGVIAVEIVGRSVDATGRETIRVDTERP